MASSMSIISTQSELIATLADLSLHKIGRHVLHYAELGSSNSLLLDMAANGAAEGQVIVVDTQNAGRGRMGRRWISPPVEAGLMLSVLLRPKDIMPFACTMMAGVALCEAVEQLCALRVALKWPNDLLVPAHGRWCKAAGMLTEISTEQNMISALVVGIGINIGWQPQGMVDGRNLTESASSLEAAAGHAIQRVALFRALIERLDRRYTMLCANGHEQLFTDWRTRLATLKTEVRIARTKGELVGFVEDVDLSGALLVRDTLGEVHCVMAGDVE